MKSILRAVAAAGLLAIAGTTAQAQAPTKVAVGYTNTASFAGLFIAKEEGMFAKRGLDVELTLINVNSNIPAALVSNSIQIGGPTPSVFLQAVEGGLDLVVVGGCSVNDVAADISGGIVARTDSNIKTPKDFEGKKVGAPGLGAYLHVLFAKWLQDKGADPKKVTFIEVPFAQGSDILKAGSVDAVVTGDPFYSRIIQSKTGYLVAPYLKDMPDGLSSIYYASTREWATKNPAAVKAFREAVDEGNNFMLKNVARAKEIIGKVTKLPPEVVATTILPKLDIKAKVSDVKYWVDLLNEQALLKTKPDAAKLVLN